LAELCKDEIHGLSGTFASLSASDDRLMDDFKEFVSSYEIDPKLFEKDKNISNPFKNRNWELHNLGLAYWHTIFEMYFTQMEIRYLEAILNPHTDKSVARERLIELRKKFEVMAQTTSGSC